ncbi:hypothetical protein BB560_007210 [Smittium megazygosporum]|uniref:5'-deoxynucleotidase n=1 Tax=Smittium megazygosporum TaxID=133381 RepID=A0A2T9XXW0_9FUNG|nr:hypothetical protein BB560_007210 [Smittium megazygosporum]
MDSKNMLGFFHLLENLKKTKRTGWINNNIPMPESISDHMYRMALMAMAVNDQTLDINRCIKIALIHDIAESIVGDITPFDNISKEEKYTLELNGILKIKELLKDSPLQDEIEPLWKEYELCETAEAKLVKDLDKFEMITQAYEYEVAHKISLQSFFDSSLKKIEHPVVVTWAHDLSKKRESMKPQ